MKMKVALLGGTGAVGQRFIQILSNHPWFELSVITGKKSAGKKYGEAVKWILEGEIPEEARDLRVVENSLENLRNVDLIFSALPSKEAKDFERELMRRGIPLVSNASALRMDPLVPLVIPEVNPDHLSLIDRQRDLNMGPVATDPNCTTTVSTLPLKPLHDAYTLKNLNITSYQAISGAGYPGIPSYDILDNVIPYIEGEEEKIQNETRKLLGTIKEDGINMSGFEVQATCVRVPVLDAHLVAVHAEFEEEVDVNDAMNLLREFSSEPQRLGLPTAPKRPIYLREERDRPQPRYDRGAGGGMSVTVGRLRRGSSSRSLLFIAVAHNTIRGAAGQAILLAELMKAKKII